jgi:hypothetical protein
LAQLCVIYADRPQNRGNKAVRPDDGRHFVKPTDGRHNAKTYGYTRTFFKILNDIEKGYIAATIDAESSIDISISHKLCKQNGKRYLSLTPGIRFSNTNLNYTNRVQEIIAGQLRVDHIRYFSKHKKDAYVVTVRKILDIIPILEQIRPYLAGKKEQANVMIEFCYSRANNEKRPYTPEQIQLAKRLHELNKRGKD